LKIAAQTAYPIAPPTLWNIGNDMSVMAGADREGIPMALCLVSLFQSVGGAITPRKWIIRPEPRIMSG
jgi:hypothetical protein